MRGKSEIVRICFFLVIATLFFWGTGHASEFCDDIKKDFEKRKVKAKVPLYDTKIGPANIIKLERDKDEIPAGNEAFVKDIECGRKKITFSLKPITNRRAEAVEIYFYLQSWPLEREKARELFDKMITYVFEKTKD